MRLTLHPDGLAPRIADFRQWRGHLLRQMERQLAPVRSARLRELYEEVTAYPLPPGGAESAADEETAEHLRHLDLAARSA